MILSFLEYLTTIYNPLTFLSSDVPSSSEDVEGTTSTSVSNSVSTASIGETPNDVDKQERIERYVRMTIQNQAESMLNKVDTV